MTEYHDVKAPRHVIVDEWDRNELENLANYIVDRADGEDLEDMVNYLIADEDMWDDYKDARFKIKAKIRYTILENLIWFVKRYRDLLDEEGKKMMMAVFL